MKVRPTLNRFTTLPVLFDILVNKQITLLSPQYWEDKNDAHYLNRYKEERRLKTLLACCFSNRTETFHHWKVFAAGPSGVCIEFHKNKLIDTIESEVAVCHKDVDYLLIKNNIARPIEDWPFLKRRAFEDEKEYRIIYSDANRAIEKLSIQIPLNCIRKITVNPWIDESIAEPTVAVIEKLCRSYSIIVNRSTLINNQRWKDCVRPA